MTNRQRPLDPARPRSRDVAPLIAAVYAREGGGAGCCLHVIVDDGNLADGFVNEGFVCEHVADRAHPECMAALAALQALSTTQRRKAIEIAHCTARAQFTGRAL